MTTIIMRTTARVVVPIILVVAILLFFQGHNLPGGGFIGGVLTVTAFALIYVAYDLDYLEIDVLDREVETGMGILDHRSVAAYRQLFTAGLVVITASCLAPLLFGERVLTQTFIGLHVPIWGELELASAILFDIGIFCVVVGAILTMFSMVGAE